MCKFLLLFKTNIHPFTKNSFLKKNKTNQNSPHQCIYINQLNQEIKEKPKENQGPKIALMKKIHPLHIVQAPGFSSEHINAACSSSRSSARFFASSKVNSRSGAFELGGSAIT